MESASGGSWEHQRYCTEALLIHNRCVDVTFKAVTNAREKERGFLTIWSQGSPDTPHPNCFQLCVHASLLSK